MEHNFEEKMPRRLVGEQQLYPLWGTKWNLVSSFERTNSMEDSSYTASRKT